MLLKSILENAPKRVKEFSDQAIKAWKLAVMRVTKIVPDSKIKVDLEEPSAHFDLGSPTRFIDVSLSRSSSSDEERVYVYYVARIKDKAIKSKIVELEVDGAASNSYYSLSPSRSAFQVSFPAKK